MSLDTAAWAEIARLWAAGDEPVGRIAKRFGITHQSITARARREAWGREKILDAGEGTSGVALPSMLDVAAVLTRIKGSRENASDAPVPRTGKDRRKARRAIVERLFDAMDRKLSVIETRIAEDGDTSPADSERTTRALNTLVRSLEKLADYEGKIGKSRGRKDGERRTAAADAERRRQELAKRVQRLLDRR